MIETKRLILRPFHEQDTEALLEIMKDKEVNTFLPWFPFKSLEETKKYLKSFYLDYQGEGFRYAICLKDDNKPIGYIHVGDGDSFDFGYALRKEFWRQGIVSEAANAFIEMLKTTDIPYITATHDVLNLRSGHVMKAIGMKYCYTYAEHWMPKDIDVNFRMYQMNFDGSDFVYQKYWNMYPHRIENLEDDSDSTTGRVQ